MAAVVQLSNDPFLNSIRLNSHLFYTNLEQISQLKEGEKLYFGNDGRISRENNSYWRAGMGLFNTYCYKANERDIKHLDDFATALYHYYHVHVVSLDKACLLKDILKLALGALDNLRKVYENQKEKVEHLHIIDKAKEIFRNLRDFIWDSSRLKESLPLADYVSQKVRLITAIQKPCCDQIDQIFPLAGDYLTDILAIKCNKIFDKIRIKFEEGAPYANKNDQIYSLANLLIKEFQPRRLLFNSSDNTFSNQDS